MIARRILGIARDFVASRREMPGIVRRMRRWDSLSRQSPDEVRSLTRRRLAGILQHAARTTPYWKELLAGRGLDPGRENPFALLRNLPLLDRRRLVDLGSRMISTAVPGWELVPARTGGSTETALRFLRDRECVRQRTALQLLFFRWAGRDPGERWALVWGAAFDLGQTTSRLEQLREYLVERRVTLPASHLAPPRMEEFLQRIDRFGAVLLHGYSQALWQLARHVAGGGHRPGTLRGITATAEPLTADQRHEIEEAFGVPVFVHYGAREIGMAAAECSHHDGLHHALPSVFLEVVDPDGQPVPPGERGELVVTDLLNRAMPFIRYRIGDTGAWLPGSCACGRGFPRLAMETGKLGHYLVLPGDRLVSGNAIAISCGRAEGIIGLYLEQERENEIRVLYRSGPGFGPGSLEQVRSCIRSALGNDVQIVFRPVSHPPIAPSGKVWLCRSTIWAARLREGGDDR